MHKNTISINLMSTTYKILNLVLHTSDFLYSYGLNIHSLGLTSIEVVSRGKALRMQIK